MELGGNGLLGGGEGRSGVALLEPLTDVNQCPALRVESNHVKIGEVPSLEEEGGVVRNGELVGRKVEDKDE